jgi:hypothetical protein
MKRQEEMRIALEQYAEPSFPTAAEEFAFMAGFRAADKTMIDKATEWLFKHVFYYPDQSHMVEMFRKDMEE